MASWLRTRVRWARVRAWLWWILPLAFAAIVLLFYPFRFVFEFDGDEGIQLMTGFLHARGHSLYSEIYRDHPPVFTILLSLLFRATGHSVTAARILVLLLSTSLLLSALYYLQAFWGTFHAVAGWLVFLMLPVYMRLSVSVMIGLPAIAFAISSFVALSFWHRERKPKWLLLSAVLLCLSVMTKLFTLIVAPIFAAGLLLSELRFGQSEALSNELKPAALWSAGFALLVVILLLFTTGPGNVSQLLDTHLRGLEVPAYWQQAEDSNINYFLAASWPLLLTSAAGMFISIRRRVWTDMYLVGWAVAAYVSLSLHVPVRDHHQLLVTVPAGILAAIFLGETASRCWRMIQSRAPTLKRLSLTLPMVAFSCFVIQARLPAALSDLQMSMPNLNLAIRPQDERDYEVLAVMWNRANKTDLVLTDRPMFAFRLGKPVPPETALFSDKRLRTGGITGPQIIELIQTMQPDQVLFARFRVQGVDAYLREVYEPAYTYQVYRLYIHPDLLSP